MKFTNLSKRGWVASALIMTLALPAFSQDAAGQREGRSDAGARSRAESQDRSRRKRRNGDAQPPNYRLQPLGWIRIAADYDNDGAYDAVETIHYYDLEKARQRSKQRGQREERNAERSQRQQKLNRDRQQFARKTSVQGEITKLQKSKSSHRDRSNVMAQVELSNGRTANVCLGPAERVSSLDLQEGDRIAADGVLTRMKGKPVLLAGRVKANGETVTHKLRRRAGINRHQGELVSLRTATSRRSDRQYCIARIDTDQGTKTVHLGPKDQLSKLDLSEGDQVSVLTRKGKVSGKNALIAVQVKANDEAVRIARQPSRQSMNRSRNRSGG